MVGMWIHKRTGRCQVTNCVAEIENAALNMEETSCATRVEQVLAVAAADEDNVMGADAWVTLAGPASLVTTWLTSEAA